MLTAVIGSRLNGGELFDYVVEKDFLEEAEAVYYMKQILEGLDFCHKLNIVHLDLKVCGSVTLEPHHILIMSCLLILPLNSQRTLYSRRKMPSS